MGKATKERVQAFDGYLPTDEQMSAAVFRPEQIVERGQVVKGVAYRRRPMIDVLADQGVFSDAEHKALKHYRHHADIAERSPIRDSLDVQRYGGAGVGPGVELVNAIRVRDDCERAAGSLVDILRAVVVYDTSLSQWAIDQSGSVEKIYTRRGAARPVTEIRPKQMALKRAKLEIQIAAKRVMAELEA